MLSSITSESIALPHHHHPMFHKGTVFNKVSLDFKLLVAGSKLRFFLKESIILRKIAKIKKDCFENIYNDIKVFQENVIKMFQTFTKYSSNTLFLHYNFNTVDTSR